VNRCDPSQRVPALEEICLGFEKCIKDNLTGHSGILAESLGDTVEAFLYAISYSSILKIVIAILAVYGSV